jgi:hypothetical protein
MSINTNNKRNRKHNHSNKDLKDKYDENGELTRHSISQLEYNSIRKSKTNNLTNASNFDQNRPLSKAYAIDLNKFNQNVNSKENKCSTQSASKGTLI